MNFEEPPDGFTKEQWVEVELYGEICSATARMDVVEEIKVNVLSQKLTTSERRIVDYIIKGIQK